MLAQPENSPVVGANPLKNPVAVQQTVIEHRNLRVLSIQKIPVDINLHPNQNCLIIGKQDVFRQSLIKRQKNRRKFRRRAI